MRYEKNEIRDLFITIILMGVVFSLSDFSAANIFLSVFLVGLAFMVKDLAHKEAARRFGVSTLYKIWPSGLLVALIAGAISQGRVLFAIPGAVCINAVRVARWKTEYTSLKNEEYGLISTAGPLANISLALIFLIMYSAFPSGILATGALINLFTAFFNLFPVPPLDGYRVMRWCRKVWIAMFFTSLIGAAGFLLF